MANMNQIIVVEVWGSEGMRSSMLAHNEELLTVSDPAALSGFENPVSLG